MELLLSFVVTLHAVQVSLGAYAGDTHRHNLVVVVVGDTSEHTRCMQGFSALSPAELTLNDVCSIFTFFMYQLESIAQGTHSA